jgi:argininosuccinate lyase
MKKPWSGRFVEKTAGIAEKYTESITFDKRLWRHDIEGSIAHVKMLAKQKIIHKQDADKIIKGLKEIYNEIEKGKFVFKKELEDIHMNIESALIKKIGDVGGKLHTARSRNDQVALDLRLYLRDQIKEIQILLRNLQKVLVGLSHKYLETVMPGYTHMQRAQPVLLSHHLMAYVHMFERDKMRLGDCLKRLNVCPLGSCALAGTSLPIDREYVAKLLGFDSVSENSIDAVSDRDFALEFLSNASILIMHISRVAHEIVMWASQEFCFVELPDAFTTGSSIMPQKKNPDVAELMRSKTGRIYGSLISLLTVMKGLPLSYNRDMQEDKESVFDAVDTLRLTITALTQMLEKTKFNKNKLYETASEGFSTATDIAEYLAMKGLPFRTAHEITGRIVRYCIENNKKLPDLSIAEYKSFSDLIEDDIYKCLDALESANAKRSHGGAATESVRLQISRFSKGLRDNSKIRKGVASS